LSHLCVAVSGTGGSVSGTGGSATGTGGSATGSGGTTGAGGSATGSGGTTGAGGSATGGGGSTGAGGSTQCTGGAGGCACRGIYTFADSAGSTITPNCTGDSCFAAVTGTGPICVSGTGVRVGLNTSGTDYDYATYWGAAMALDLNNPTNLPMGQQAYVASAHG